MAWLKESDTSANHPIVLRVLEEDDADDRILNELFGFANRCAVMSAQHEQDYIVTVGTARAMAGSFARYQALADAAVRAGYFTRVMIPDEDGTERLAFKLVEDNDLFHMILKDERAWNNRRKRDTSNQKLTIPIRLRDGDACRWCGQVVSWNGDRKSGRHGTYDHLRPGVGAETAEDMVVACGACNSARQDDKSGSWEGILRPVPDEPYYSAASVALLAKHGHIVKPSEKRKPFRPAPAAATGKHASVESETVESPAVVRPTVERPQGDAPADPAPAKDAPVRAPEEAPRSAAEPSEQEALSREIPGSETICRDPADRGSPESGFVGTGRDGTGLAGKGRAGPGRAGDGSGWDGSRAGSGGAGSRKKKRRGKRGGRR
ncbi:HNH endonuclease [Micrococcus terreus]|uniref:HNH endonuclease n=1 Tax=Micrococcus terreus TaxID=574650 RepID=UPI00254A03CC|nr:hypothetical protein [Micrococcus terreus]MDK7701505.1 hypothetical protein [Micrococcus terreus]WOO98205.1 hypothetical protein R3I42_03420 [Micrococcus terreus]